MNHCIPAAALAILQFIFPFLILDLVLIKMIIYLSDYNTNRLMIILASAVFRYPYLCLKRLILTRHTINDIFISCIET